MAKAETMFTPRCLLAHTTQFKRVMKRVMKRVWPMENEESNGLCDAVY